MRRILIWAALLAGFGLFPTARAFETSLLDIELRAPYKPTLDLLKGLYGKPVEYGSNGTISQTFKISAQNHLLTVKGSADQNQVIGLELKGDDPYPDLGFVDQLNLGMSDSEVDEIVGIPSIAQAGQNGYRRHNFPHSNFTLDMKQGRVHVISIFIPGGDKIPTDYLKAHCRSRHAFWQQQGLLLTRAVLDFQKTKRPVIGRIDTAAAQSSISPTICQKLGCRIFNNKTRQTSGGAIRLGYEVKQHNLFYADVPLNTQPAFDLTIGANQLFADSLILNFKHNYICIPKTPMETIAKALELKKTLAKVGISGVRLEISANGKKLPDLLLDSSSPDTALTMDLIRQLKLAKSGTQTRLWGNERLKADEYRGAISLELSNLKTRVDTIYLATSKRHQKLGNSIFGDRIWGFDPKAGSVYYSP